MVQKTTLQKQSLILLLAAVLAPLLVFLSAPVLRVGRNISGPTLFWSFGAGAFAILYVLHLVQPMFILGSIWLAVGLYSELEIRGKAGFWSAVAAITVGTLFLTIGPFLWLKSQGTSLETVLVNSISYFVKMIPNQTGLEEKEITKIIVTQIPSMIFLLHLTCLGVALISERKIANLLGVRFERIASQIKPLEFRVPDYLIWLTMAAFLFSFVKLNNESVNILSLNVFNCLMGFYFFQGLAVLEVLLLVFRTGAVVKALIYLIVIAQLFFVLSVVGVIDFWVDFRKRLRKFKMNEKNQNNGEKI